MSTFAETILIEKNLPTLFEWESHDYPTFA